MNWERVFLLSFEIGQPNAEVLQSAAALYFKLFSKGRDVIWYNCKRPPNYEGYSFSPVCRAKDSGKTSTCGIYAISHGLLANFGGFKSAEDGAKLIWDFMKEAGISDLNQLNLVACGVVHPKDEGKYLKSFAEEFKELASPKTSLKLVAWQAFVTIFDMRYLAKLLCGSEPYKSTVDGFRKEIIQILRKSAAQGAEDLIKLLDQDSQRLIGQPQAGKSFFGETGTNFAEHLKTALGKQGPDVIAQLVGKKVGRIRLNQTGKDFFTRTSPHIPPSMLNLVHQAIELKKAQTFDWAFDVQENKAFQINNSVQENTL